MMPPLCRPLLLVLVLALGGSCCGSPCSTSLEFAGPVPDLTVLEGETTSYDLFRNVWELATYCDGGLDDSAGFPDVEVHVRDDQVASAVLDGSRLQLRGLQPGETQVVLRASAEVACEHVYDATHFTLSVQ